MRNQIFTFVTIACCPFSSNADDTNYVSDIKPVLRERCYACHGALKQESGLRLDTAASVRHGGDGGVTLSGRVGLMKVSYCGGLHPTTNSSGCPPKGNR